MNQLNQEHLALASLPEATIRKEICSISAARRVAAMLDLNPDDVVEGAPLPRGWQFILLGADTKRSLLRADGFPGLGVSMPDIGLPRLMLGSRSVAYREDIPIGASVIRHSFIQSFKQKSTKSGPMAVATIQHELRLGSELPPALIETQTYLLLPATKGATLLTEASIPPIASGDLVKTVVPNETLLFHYSALGFNSHKIHLDRAYARNVEGFPDLVVNGGLSTLLLTDFFRQETGATLSSFTARHLAPLYCGSPITLVVKKIESKWQLQAYDNRSTLAVDIEVETHAL
jgi:3-methylfumaryl-CoA hydratase